MQGYRWDYSEWRGYSFLFTLTGVKSSLVRPCGAVWFLAATSSLRLFRPGASLAQESAEFLRRLSGFKCNRIKCKWSGDWVWAKDTVSPECCTKQDDPQKSKSKSKTEKGKWKKDLREQSSQEHQKQLSKPCLVVLGSSYFSMTWRTFFGRQEDTVFLLLE